MRPVAVNAELDQKSVRKFLNAIYATPGQVGRAQFRAVSKTTKWATTQVSRALAAHNDMPYYIFKGNSKNKKGRRVRPKIFHKSQGFFKPGRSAAGRGNNKVKGSIWIGLDDIKVKYLGKPRQQKKGVRVRRTTYAGAFVRDYGGGGVGVLQRNLSGKIVAVRDPVWGVPIDGVQKRIPARLLKTTDQELNYEINVRGARK